jgi:hypothetical protein
METLAPTTSPRTTVSWTEDENTAIALAYIREREMDAIGNAIEMLRRGIQKCVDAGHARYRDINTWAACPAVKQKVDDLWLEKMAAQNPAPTVIEIEKQTTPDYLEILQRCDLPSLVALVTAKVLEQTRGISAAIHALAPHTNGHIGAPLVPPVSLLAAASTKPRKTRVLIAGPLSSQFREIEKQIQDSQIPVELLWLDKDKNPNGVTISADYVVANEFMGHHISRALKESTPAGRFFFLQGRGIESMVNKIRDLGALTPPRT